MNVGGISFVAFVIAVCTSQSLSASEQSDATGFVEGGHLAIKARNMYMNRDNRATGATQSYGEEWAQGFVGLLESGYTQGVVGLGADLFGKYGVKLDTGDGRFGGGTNLLEADNNGAKDEYSKGGGVLKMRISNSVLKYGTQIMTLPVLNISDTRLLPETVDGFSLTSREVKDLRFDVGHFTSQTNRNESSSDSGRMTSVNYVGGQYKFTNQTTGSLYYAETDDYFRKYYLNTNYVLPLSNDQSLKFDFNGYDTKSIGQARSGGLDNRIWSLSAAYNLGAHTFLVANQRVSGKGDYIYGPDGGATSIFSNSVQYSDFDYEDEKSWQARYDLNMAPYGVNGLGFIARYIKGYDFKNGKGVDLDGNAWERDIEVRYVVQSGAARNLTFRLRQASYRSTERGGQLDEVRVITEYPFNVF